MFRSKLFLFLFLCFCVFAIPTVSTKGDSIQVNNNTMYLDFTLSDFIVYGDPNKPEEKKVLLAPNNPDDDIVLGPQASRIFDVDFHIKSYTISKAFPDELGNYREYETLVLEVQRLVPKKLAMIDVGPYIQEQLRAALEIDQSIPSEPPPEGTILAFVDGYNELMPGWFVGTDINFETGEVTGAYTGNIEVVSTDLEVLVFTPPYPPDGATDIPLYADIFWTKSEHADHFEVFFGTDFSNMKDMFIGYQDGDDCSYDPGPLEPCTTYYWKINEACIEYVEVQYGEFIVLEEQTYVITGSLHSFTTGFTKATNPYPADFAIEVDPNTILSWTPGCGAIFHDVYLGDSYDAVSDANSTDLSGIYRGIYDTDYYNPGGLEPGTTYYWRINEVNESGIISEGSVWRFTTKTEQCVPTAEELTPPPTPQGYEYVGYDLVIDYVLVDTTIPLDYTESSEDIRYIRSRTTVKDGVCVCDIIVSFLFRKVEDCGPTEEELTPPATPEGYEYVGYDVVVNFVLTESTIPLDYTESPDDIIAIRSHTIVKNGQTECDVIVRHLFRKK